MLEKRVFHTRKDREGAGNPKRKSCSFFERVNDLLLIVSVPIFSMPFGKIKILSAILFRKDLICGLSHTYLLLLFLDEVHKYEALYVREERL